MQSLPKIISSRYVVQNLIAEGAISYVYLAGDARDPSRRCAVKLLKEKFLSSRTEDVIRFNAEAAIASGIIHPNVVRIHECGEFESIKFIAMEYIEGESLARVIESRVPLGIDQIVDIVIQVCEGLGCIHDHRIIHRDIKPGNIMLGRGPASQQREVKIIDFGLSRIRDYGAISSEDEVVGTFSYMSPEQTGVLKRKVDERSDLYSLGIVFYQLLTGELPFKSTNISSLIHSHIAIKPVMAKKMSKDWPDILSRIVLKLLEKEPESRYQSARGLLNDLKRFRDGYRDFSLGEYDKIIKLNFHSHLVGRRDELMAIQRAFNSTIKGNGRIILVKGEAGMGKSRLAEELRAYVYARGGLFIEVKCFRALNNVPYGPFRDALNIFLSDYRRKTEWEKSQISSVLNRSLGGLGAIAVQLHPDMKEILGACAPLVSLEPDRENQRFLHIAARLFCAIGQAEHALVLQLDDLQWADESSFALMQEIALNVDKHPLLVIGTYRMEEVDGAHGVMKLRAGAEQGGFNLQEIELVAFDAEQTAGLISGILYQNDEVTRDISRFIHGKSKGNPFFAIEVLKQMVEENAVVFRDDRWTVDDKVLDSIEISPELIDIIIRRISLLGPEEKAVLSWASVIGRRVSVEYLLAMGQAGSADTPFAGDTGKQRILESIDKTVSLQFLELALQEKGMLQFTHDRIREIFYSELDEAEKRRLHLAVAALIEASDTNADENLLFELAYHYIEAGREDKILQYAYPAAARAKDNHANAQALRYLEVVIEVIERGLARDESSESREKWFSCKKMAGEIFLVIGEIEKAIALYNAVLEYIETDIDKAEIYRLIGFAYFKRGDWESCERYSRMGLKLLGERLPASRVFIVLNIPRELLLHTIRRLGLFILAEPGGRKSSERARRIVSIYSSTNWMYILTDVSKFVNSVIRSLNISERKIGSSSELGASMGAYASFLMAIPRFSLSLKYHERALEMRRECGDEWGVGQSLQWMGYCNGWQGELKRSDAYFEQSLQIFRKIGDMWEIGMALGGLAYNSYLASAYERSVSLNREYQVISRKLSDHYGLSRCLQHYAICLIERGEFSNAEEYALEAMEIVREHKLIFNECFNMAVMGYLCLEMKRYEEAIKHLEQAKDLYEKNHFLKDYTLWIYPLLAEAFLRQYILEHKNILKRDLVKLGRIKRLCEQAARKTRRWPNQHPRALRVSALFHSFMGNARKAEAYFIRSVDMFSRGGRRFETAKTLMEYGEFLRQAGNESLWRQKIESAYRIAMEIGAEVYRTKASEMLGLKEEGRSASPSRVIMDRSRLSSIINFSQDISSILNLDELLDHIMSKAVEATGAQRGLLFVVDPGTGELELMLSRNTVAGEGPEYSSSIIHGVHSTGQPVIAVNAEKEDEFSVLQSVIRYGLKSILCVPIMLHQKVTGVCYLDNPLSSGVFSREDAVILGVFMSQAGIAIENAYLYQNLEQKVRERTSELNKTNEELGLAYSSVSEAYSIIKEDLSLARRIQESLLPRDYESIEGLKFFLHFYPMSDVGGDIYDILELVPGYVRIFIADATGHGVQAALQTMIILSEYDKIKRESREPSWLVDRLNRICLESYGTLHMMFTCAVIDLDLSGGMLFYSGAGHPTQYLIRSDGILHLEKTGRIIGMIPESGYQTRRTQLRAGDRILMLTDGLYEQFNNSGKTYGQERMLDVIDSHRGRPINDIINAIIDDLRDFMKYKMKINESDDITVIGISVDRVD